MKLHLSILPGTKDIILEDLYTALTAAEIPEADEICDEINALLPFLADADDVADALLNFYGERAIAAHSEEEKLAIRKELDRAACAILCADRQGKKDMTMAEIIRYHIFFSQILERAALAHQQCPQGATGKMDEDGWIIYQQQEFWQDAENVYGINPHRFLKNFAEPRGIMRMENTWKDPETEKVVSGIYKIKPLE